MEFDKEVLIKNIDFLCENEGIKKSELETDIGASNGYLTRISKKNNETKPNIDLVCRIASRFKIDVNSLLFCNFSTEDRDSELKKKFLMKLISETDNSYLEWKVEKARNYLAKEVKDLEGDHPLYEINNALVQSENYTSKFFSDDNITLGDKIYTVKLYGAEYVYLIQVFDENKEPYYEMYSMSFDVYDDFGHCVNICKKCIPLLNTKGSQSPYCSLINSLLKLVICQNSGQRMSKESKDFMESYLQENIPLNF